MKSESLSRSSKKGSHRPIETAAGMVGTVGINYLEEKTTSQKGVAGTPKERLIRTVVKSLRQKT